MASVKCNKMIRVIGYGHLEKGGKDINGWNSEKKGVFL